MSKLITKNDFQTQNWIVTEENLDSFYVDLYIGFVDQNPIINFVNLKFGYNLKSGETEVISQSYPPKGVKYEQTDQEFIIVDRLDLEPETSYSIFLWAENAGNRYEYTYDFTTPSDLSEQLT